MQKVRKGQEKFRKTRTPYERKNKFTFVKIIFIKEQAFKLGTYIPSLKIRIVS